MGARRPLRAPRPPAYKNAHPYIFGGMPGVGGCRGEGAAGAGPESPAVAIGWNLQRLAVVCSVVPLCASAAVDRLAARRKRAAPLSLSSNFLTGES